MENDKNYFTVGVFILVMIMVGVGFTLWLTSPNRGGFDHFRIRFAESVSGLSNNSTVKFRGVDVGNVESIEIDPEDAKLIIVDIRVRPQTPVKADTTATLRLKGITGDLYVELNGGSDDAPRLASEGEQPEIKAEPSSINAIMNGLPHLLDKANHIADQLSKMFSDDNVKAVGRVVHGVSGFFGKSEKPKEEQRQADYPEKLR